MAQWYAKGKLKVGDSFLHESIIGSLFTGKVEKVVTVDGKPAIILSAYPLGNKFSGSYQTTGYFWC